MMGANTQQGFLFGGDTGVSYDSLQQKRRVVEALMANANRMPRNVGEGLHAISNALVVRGLNKQIEQGQAQGESNARGLIAQALQGDKAPQYAPQTPSQPYVPSTPEQEIGDDTMMALGRPDMVGKTNFDFGSYAVGGAASRDDSFTGLKPEMQTALMPFLQAADRELGPGALKVTSAYRSPELQAQLWQNALKKYGSAEAARKWVAPPGSSQHNFGTAVDFAGADGGLLRDANSPEAQWIRSNAAKYGLAVPMDWEPWQVELAGARGQAQGQPMQPPQQPDYSAFYEALSSPWLDQGQRVMLMAELEDRKAADNRAYAQWQQQSDPMRQLQLQKAQLELEQMQNPQPGFSLLTPEQEVAMGLDPAGSYQRGADGKISQIGGSGTNVSVTTGEGAAIPDYPRAPDGYMYVRNPDTGQVVLNEQGIATMAPIIGGPEDTSRADAQAAQVAAQTEATRSSVVVDTVNEIRDTLKKDGLFDLPEVGVIGSKLKFFNQESADMAGMLETLKGMVVFDRLEQLKKASATGASGLGQVTEKEIDLLGAQLGALRQDMSKERIEATLDTIESVFGKLSPEAEAYLTGQSEALPNGRPQRAAPQAPASDFSSMEINELNAIDIDTLTPAQQDALSRRYQELGY